MSLRRGRTMYMTVYIQYTRWHCVGIYIRIIMLLLLFLIFSRHAGVYATPSGFVDRTLDVRQRGTTTTTRARRTLCVRVCAYGPPSTDDRWRGVFRVATCRRRCLWRQSRGITALPYIYIMPVYRVVSASLSFLPQSWFATARLTIPVNTRGIRRDVDSFARARVCVRVFEHCDKNTRPPPHHHARRAMHRISIALYGTYI